MPVKVTNLKGGSSTSITRNPKTREVVIIESYESSSVQQQSTQQQSTPHTHTQQPSNTNATPTPTVNESSSTQQQSGNPNIQLTPTANQYHTQEVTDKLKQMFAKHSTDVLDNATLFCNILGDYLTDYPKEQNILQLVFRIPSIGSKLNENKSAAPPEQQQVKRQVVATLVDDYSQSRETAEFAIDVVTTAMDW
ncbi:MAG: hypothetical protein FWG65_03310 [Turicibacter sp.]|nr:hypothetical protein [Turicibacter sp.]